jgi:hypothetical protein
VVAIAAVASAGCGGSGGGSPLSAADYKAKIAAIGKEASQAQGSVESGLKTNTPAALADALATFSSAEERMSKEVAGLNPPGNAQAANTELAQGLHDISAATDSILPQVRSAASVTAAVKLLNKSTDGAKAGHEVDDALAKLQKLGYATGS